MTYPRYLTKTRYKLGLECPTKLYYTGKKEFPNVKMDDPFLEALAQGGYQVGELAKHYFPGGHDITSLDYEFAESQTNELLRKDNVIIYEPAIRFNNLFVRIDVLIKQDNHFELIEVKAKSIDPKDKSPFMGKRGELKSDWKAYLYDVAFQNFVLANAFPKYSICNFLMLADKHAQCATDALNQKFKISRDNNRKGVTVSNTLSAEDLEHPILVKMSIDEEIAFIHEAARDGGKTFPAYIDYLAHEYEKDVMIPPRVGAHCKKCEFVCDEEQEAEGLKSGFNACWQQGYNLSEKDFSEPNIFELWIFRRTQALIDTAKFKLSDLTKEDLNVKTDGQPGLSNSQRQWLQVEMRRNGKEEAYLDVLGMKAEMDSWVFPLHFIDFETTTVALPFTKGRRPYEIIAFQFSHHVVYQDGRIEHIGQYMNTERGIFPNIDFLRALKSELEGDDGTIFRYADHENNVLNAIYKQLEANAAQIADADELLAFIQSISHSTRKVEPSWTGDRDMVDMLKLVKRYYYHPAMKGSNSLKAVLPATLNDSVFLQDKYSQPIYGSELYIKSLNFTDHIWILLEDGKIVNPYKQLPTLFSDVSEKNIDLLTDENELADGGAAMMAYSKIQFESMSEYERDELEQALFKYCELDTLAMVMLYEAWRYQCG